VPIYERGGEVHARVRQAKHTHVQALQLVEQQRTVAQERVVSAWSAYTAAKAQIESDRAQVAATRTALAGVREEERVGQRTLLDVLNAEAEALNAEVGLVRTQRDLVVRGYALLASVGRLSAAETGVTSKAYDPDVHYHEIRRKWWGISITRSDGRREVHDMWETHGVKYEENRLK
jgi:outer membrane protein